MTYTIYLRTNTANNKQYVGQTKNFHTRENNWRCFKKTYGNDYLSNDREKYGLDAWTVKVLAECNNREDSWELERSFIKDYNTIWPNGYNITEGGGGANGLKHSDEAKKKISEAHKGKHHTEETKQKISEAHKGKHHTEEHKQKISEANKGKHTKKQVFQYTLDGKLVAIWPSAKDAEEKLGICHISDCCHGKRKSAGGFKWSFIKL